MRDEQDNLIGDELEEATAQLDAELTEVRRGIRDWIVRIFWRRIPEKYRQNLEPEVLATHLLDGEEKQLEIHLAWYRDLLNTLVIGHIYWWLITAVLCTVLLLLAPINRLWAVAPTVIMLLLLIEAAREFIEYHQWRLVKTNRRLIISLPQHGAWPLVDNIEIGDSPRVIDTNWSANPLWRTFQLFTGARDVYISLTAFKFDEHSARVRDALIFPDVMPEDVFQLKQFVFGRK